MHGICKRVLFYKEEMDVAIRVESLQFGKTARKLKTFEKKGARVERNTYFYNLKTGIQSGKSTRKLKSFEKFWKKVCESWKKDIFLQPKNEYRVPAAIQRQSDLNIRAVESSMGRFMRNSELVFHLPFGDVPVNECRGDHFLLYPLVDFQSNESIKSLMLLCFSTYIPLFSKLPKIAQSYSQFLPITLSGARPPI